MTRASVAVNVLPGARYLLLSVAVTRERIHEWYYNAGGGRVGRIFPEFNPIISNNPMKKKNEVSRPDTTPVSIMLKTRRQAVFVVSMVVGGLCLIAVAFFLIRAYRVEQVQKRVRDTMLECRAFHEYIQHGMHPVYQSLMKEGRLPQGFYSPEMLSSSYMARAFQKIYNQLRSEIGLPGIQYKMASANPRNPINQADSFECALIKQFNADRSKTSFNEVVKENGKKYLLCARPFLPVETRCLKCHGNPEDAPKDLKTIYDWKGGFHLKGGDIVAIETVRSPLDGEFNGSMVAMMIIGLAVIVLVLLMIFNNRLRLLVNKKTAQLEEERERLSVSLRSIGDGVITVGLDGKIDLVNRVAEQLTGWKQGEARGKRFEEVFRIVNKETRKSYSNPVEKVLSMGEIIELDKNTVLIARDGTERIVADSGAPIRDKNSAIVGAVLVFRDVTEKTMYEEIMLRSDKLDSLAVLAGGIAHDFNNLLGGIFGYVDMANDVTTEQGVKAHLEKSLSTVDRARALTQQLLTFAKGGVPIKKTAPLFPFINDTATFALCGSTVTLTSTVQENLWVCDYDKNQIGQVIDNLVINANQAMESGGEITLDAQNVRFDTHGHGILSPGCYVRIIITDTGGGIAPEILSRIFDPFFTTKKKGHGLGLATCNSIIEHHGGCIEVASRVGVGTTFTLYLPASENRPVVESQDVQQGHHGKGIVYVLDDEEVMREALADMLTSFGYEVVSCENGEEIVAAVKCSDASRNTACIFDLTVRGGMGGIETLREIRLLDTRIPVFVTSGYSEDPVMADPKKYGFAASIRKPFRRSELIEMLCVQFTAT